MADNLVFLKFRNDEKLEDGTRAMLACVVCRNKTYRAIVDTPDSFPMMECAGCGAHIGRFGWAEETK